MRRTTGFGSSSAAPPAATTPVATADADAALELDPVAAPHLPRPAIALPVAPATPTALGVIVLVLVFVCVLVPPPLPGFGCLPQAPFGVLLVLDAAAPAPRPVPHAPIRVATGGEELSTGGAAVAPPGGGPSSRSSTWPTIGPVGAA